MADHARCLQLLITTVIYIQLFIIPSMLAGVDVVSNKGKLKWPHGRHGLCGDAFNEKKWDVPGQVQQTYMQGQVRKPLPQQQQQQVTEVVVLEGRVMLHELITACCVSHGATGDAAVANAAVRSCPASVSTWLLLHLQLSSMLLTV
jgi:hypothetical protein